MKTMPSLVFLALFAAGCQASTQKTPDGEHAKSLVLITPEEATQGRDFDEAKSLQPSKPFELLKDSGPRIEVGAPDLGTALTNPFEIWITFAPGASGAKPDIDTFKLIYKKLWGIDLTDRVRSYLKPEGIRAPAVELPAGKHTVEISISDEEGRESRALATIIVKD